MRKKLSFDRPASLAVLAFLLAAVAGVAVSTESDAAGSSQNDAAPESTDVQPSRSPTGANSTSGQQSAGRKGPPPITGYVLPRAKFQLERQIEFTNEEGTLAVSYSGEPFATANHPFFRVRPNGRACVTCHQPIDAMGISTKTIRERWNETNGRDPLFHPSDGANCPHLPRGDAKSHSLLLERGLFRVGMRWPPKDFAGNVIEPEFEIEVATDPTGCNTHPQYGLTSANPTVSVYRRSRMAANVRYLESAQAQSNTKTGLPLVRDPVTGIHSSMSIMSDARVTSLAMQAQDAGGVHMGMGSPGGADSHLQMSRAEADELVEFQRKVHAAQQASKFAGRFDVPNTPRALGVKPLIEGRGNPPINGNDTDVGVFYQMEEWRGPVKSGDPAADFRASVVRGYDIFFTRPIWLRDVFGITNFGLGNPYKQTCAFCHNTLLTGHDDVPGWMDLGTNNFPHAPADPELPTFKITCKASALPHPYLGREIYTHDPGRALVTGKCTDVGSLVMQQFRGLAARGPYFANGSANSIREVVDFYDRRFNVGYTDQDKQDLINFLSVL
jgi:hypothetical protein